MLTSQSLALKLNEMLVSRIAKFLVAIYSDRQSVHL